MVKRKARETKEAKEREKQKAKEAREKAKREAKEAREKEKLKAQKAKEREKRKAAEAKAKAKQEAREAKKAEKPKPAKEEAVEPKEGVGLYQGMVKLNIMLPIDFAQLNSLKQALLEIKDLRVVMISGAMGEGSRILVSAEEPLPLLNILRGIPAVGEVTPKGNEIQVSLKAR